MILAINFILFATLVFLLFVLNDALSENRSAHTQLETAKERRSQALRELADAYRYRDEVKRELNYPQDLNKALLLQMEDAMDSLIKATDTASLEAFLQGTELRHKQLSTITGKGVTVTARLTATNVKGS